MLEKRIRDLEEKIALELEKAAPLSCSTSRSSRSFVLVTPNEPPSVFHCIQELPGVVSATPSDLLGLLGRFSDSIVVSQVGRAMPSWLTTGEHPPQGLSDHMYVTSNTAGMPGHLLIT